MLARYLNGLAAELDEQGRRAFIWGDQFLDAQAWKGTGYIATSRPDQMTHLALEKLDRRLIIADWQYSLTEEEKIRSAELFSEKGFDVVLCPWDGGGAKNTVCSTSLRSAAFFAVTPLTVIFRFLPRVKSMWVTNSRSRDRMRPSSTAPGASKPISSLSA